jgi:DNA-binding response OmpR family regulator
MNSIPHAAARKAPPNTAAAAAPPVAGGARSAKKRLLLVDDDPAIRQIVMRLLTEEGYSVLTAVNGVEALVQVASMKFDLVVLDLNLPIKDGWGTLEQLTTENPLLPIILITARPNQFFPALAAGVGALLEKPLDFVKFFDTIRALLEERPEQRQARISGRPAQFHYGPPKVGQAEGAAPPPEAPP